MKFNLRSQTAQGIAAVKSQFKGVQTRCRTAFQTVKLQIQTITQAQFRWIRLQLSRLTKLSPQSTLLKLIAIGAAALMIGLAIGAIQFALSNHTVSDAKPVSTETPASLQPKPTNWAGLPIAPAANPGQPIQPTAPSKPASPSALAEAPTPAKPSPTAQSATKAAAKPPGKTATKTAPASAPQAASQPLPAAPATVPPGSISAALAPAQVSMPADPSNYGDRYARDIFGNPVQNDPLIVLHETVGSAESAINMFRTHHTDESLQASYHSIVRLDGTIVYLVPPEKRAFGAGNSVFVSNKGQETVKTHQQFPPSVNNFAYHISLESPPDGDNMAETHSGYTEAQYRSLAWLVANSSIPDDRITTHREIDRSGSRIDPRSFDKQKFLSYLRSLPRPYLN